MQIQKRPVHVTKLALKQVLMMGVLSKSSNFNYKAAYADLKGRPSSSWNNMCLRLILVFTARVSIVLEHTPYYGVCSKTVLTRAVKARMSLKLRMDKQIALC